MTMPGVALTGVQKKTITDRVQLPRLYLAWLTPRHFEPGDAALDVVADVLAGGKNSRLYKRLVYDMQIAQDVSAFQSVAGAVVVVPDRWRRRGRATPSRSCRRSSTRRSQKLQREPPDARELERALNQIEASFYDRMERVGGFGGKADQLNAYYTDDRRPRLVQRGSRALPRAVGRPTSRPPRRAFLPLDRRVELIVEPEKDERPDVSRSARST